VPLRACQCSLSSHLGDELWADRGDHAVNQDAEIVGHDGTKAWIRVMLGAKASGARFLRNRSSRLASSPCREKFVFSCHFFR
jgi:hypothetical protein